MRLYIEKQMQTSHTYNFEIVSNIWVVNQNCNIKAIEDLNLFFQVECLRIWAPIWANKSKIDCWLTNCNSEVQLRWFVMDYIINHPIENRRKTLKIKYSTWWWLSTSCATCNGVYWNRILVNVYLFDSSKGWTAL